MLNYAHPEVLVDTQWLAENLNNDKIRIVEVAVNPQKIPESSNSRRQLSGIHSPI